MAYTEFYCDNANGDNLNAGTGGTNDYTTAGGNWTNATRTFTVTDGTNASTKVSVGDFCAVYVTSGATVATFVGRVNTVQNATNGTVVFTTAFMGANPSNGTGTMTLKHGGFWKGPNAAQAFPLDRANIGLAINSSSDRVRINLKNNQSYSITSSMGTLSGLGNVVVQGYSSSPGDGGKATIDGSTNSITLATDNSTGSVWSDFIFSSSATSGSVNNFVFAGTDQTGIRLVSHGARVSGIAGGGGGTLTLFETETYDCNKSNSSNRGGTDITGTSAAILINCISHDNTGNANNGFTISSTTAASSSFINPIAFNNGLNGLVAVAGSSSPRGSVNIINGDFYNNGGDAIKIGTTTVAGVFYWIANCNFIKNTGKGINNAASNANFVQGRVYNCGYGAGTQVNGGGDATLGSLVESGKITYANDVTPWVAPSTGNFSINLSAAEGTGRGHFEENDGTNTGTVGYPDIGAAQALISSSGGQRGHTFGG